ncbi:sulfite exporter TauE/SafE family protein [Acuticoccus sp. I52.16.1]|uniref:sulfite exporter TauE/SafE family protein n=1 Tax=Acuticoccus sp. I52.16.1 TaxID=2928472 RepID=UPI001FD15397|nr:sulfite exporter TauE/SafE family protein [Acuticoccus sp. I52.16.1]UOM36507.1 sulfite exporter TauE/SafE family protein [Acuticoccus sp. I52.16.1]
MSALLPDAVAPLGAVFLIVLSFFTSALTAAVGIGGGVVLLAAMTFVVPAVALVPLHGVVQLGSNTGRAIVMARNVALRLIVPFGLGAVLGAVLGGMLVVELPAQVILLAIGVTILLTTWMKLPPLGKGERGILAAGGLLATCLTMFVGATGPFVMMILRQSGLPHARLVATHAMAMVIQHGFKVVAFTALGFAFADWAPMMALMIAAGFCGTLVGARLLNKLPEATLKRALNIVLTLIALQLIVRSLVELA